MTSTIVPLEKRASGEASHSDGGGDLLGTGDAAERGLGPHRVAARAVEHLPCHLGLHEPRRHAGDRDAVRRQRQRHRLREGVHPGLGRAVGRVVRLAAEGPAAGDVDDRAAAGGDQVRHRAEGGVRRADEVDRQRPRQAACQSS